MRSRILLLLLLIEGFTQALAQPPGVRDRTRPEGFTRDTTVSARQAVDLTLTLVKVAPRALQTWIRTAATIDDSGTILQATLCFPDAALVRLGQRVRVFPPDSKSSVYQARISSISSVTSPGGCLGIKADLAGRSYEQSMRYVIEIVVQRGEFLAIPNEAIIEEGDRQIVYVLQGMSADIDADEAVMQGHYLPREIHMGLRGELYTEILDGLSEGDQVVTLGSFFIDAEYKLKATEQATMSNAHHHH